VAPLFAALGAMIPVARRGPTTMDRVTCQISISLDGFVAGPNQSVDNPLGGGGEGLHEWVIAVTHVKYRVVS
jgi:hypothetical protein